MVQRAGTASNHRNSWPLLRQTKWFESNPPHSHRLLRDTLAEQTNDVTNRTEEQRLNTIRYTNQISSWFAPRGHAGTTIHSRNLNSLEPCYEPTCLTSSLTSQPRWRCSIIFFLSIIVAIYNRFPTNFYFFTLIIRYIFSRWIILKYIYVGIKKMLVYMTHGG